jgi:hypothetical protein
LGELNGITGREAADQIGFWTTPAWKYTHSEQVLSQVLLQLQASAAWSLVIEATLIAFDWSPRPWAQGGRSFTEEQQSAGQAWYKTPPKPVDQVVTSATSTT